MKALSTVVSTLVQDRRRQRNLLTLIRLLAAFLLMILTFTVSFQWLMAAEGQQHSWLTAVYWTFTVMSTLGFGDITFTSDGGRLFSVLVLLSGTIFMLVLLPFAFIQFFFLPWLDAREQARAPKHAPSDIRGHVLLTRLGTVDESLIRMLNQAKVPYVLIVPELNEALRLHDVGYRVMVGEWDDPETYRRARVEHAALVVTTLPDTANSNVVFTVREICPQVRIVATASAEASVDILELAGCDRVLRLGEMLGQSLARRVLGRDAKSHVIGQFGELLIAEAAAAGTPLVGRTLSEIQLREQANVTVVGVWQRGRFEIAGPTTPITESTVLVLAGTRAQLDDYDALLCIYKASDKPVIIVGGGRVGRAVGRALAGEGIEYRIVERQAARVRDPKRYVLGDAADLEVLQKAGIEDCASVVITTHDDDVNVYLTLYCRRLRPEVQILARANLERNVSTLHRAGADFVLSYAATGATVIYNLLQRSDVLLLAEGLHVFRLPVPGSLGGRTLAESGIRQQTGCNVIAVIRGTQIEVNPNAFRQLSAECELVIIGDAAAERRFLEQYADALTGAGLAPWPVGQGEANRLVEAAE